MELLVIRHGIAVEPSPATKSDAERPLTEQGREKFREAANGLARCVRAPDVILTSPLVRARQTAEIAAAAWGAVRVVVDRRLAGGTPDQILAAIDEHANLTRAAVVGHEPDVSHLAAHLLGSSHGTRLAFDKGGAALFDLGEPPTRGGSLLWFLPQNLLRRLG